jgi:hypothetical protein
LLIRELADSLDLWVISNSGIEKLRKKAADEVIV